MARADSKPSSVDRRTLPLDEYAKRYSLDIQNGPRRDLGHRHLDFHGPWRTADLDGNRCFVSISSTLGVPNYYRPMRLPSDLMQMLDEIQAEDYGVWGGFTMDCDPNAVRSSSYSLQGPLEQYCNRLGIPLYLKTPGKHCAVAERAGRTVYEHCTAAMQDAGVNAAVFMGCAVRMFEQISRCTPKLVLGWRTPHEVLTGRKPVVCQHRPFAPVLIYKGKTARGAQAAFQPRVDRGIYLGCAPRQPLGTFLILNLRTSKKCSTSDVYIVWHYEYCRNCVLIVAAAERSLLPWYFKNKIKLFLLTCAS